MSEVKGDVLKLKKRGEDGNRVITVRIKEETLSEIDRIAKEVNYSRNELINTILERPSRYSGRSFIFPYFIFARPPEARPLLSLLKVHFQPCFQGFPSHRTGPLRDTLRGTIS